MTDTSSGSTNPQYRAWLRPDGIVQVVWEPRTVIRLEDVVASADAVDRLMDGHRHPLMVDARAAGALDRASRKELSHRGGLVSAMALIVNTPLGRMSGNVFLTVSRPKMPTRLFEDEASALAWLGDFAP